MTRRIRTLGAAIAVVSVLLAGCVDRGSTVTSGGTSANGDAAAIDNDLATDEAPPPSPVGDLTILYPLPGHHVFNPVDIAYEPAGLDGVASVQFIVDGETVDVDDWVGAPMWTLELDDTEPGTISITVEMVDTDGEVVRRGTVEVIFDHLRADAPLTDLLERYEAGLITVDEMFIPAILLASTGGDDPDAESATSGVLGIFMTYARDISPETMRIFDFLNGNYDSDYRSESDDGVEPVAIDGGSS